MHVVPEDGGDDVVGVCGEDVDAYGAEDNTKAEEL